MTARITARLTTSFLLLAIAFVAFLLLVAGPASAHHREDHTNGKVASAGTVETDSGSTTDGSETSGTETGSTATGSGSDKATVESSSSTSTATASASAAKASVTSSSTGSTDRHATKAAAGVEKHGFDPDPVQTASPPATKGPLTCPAYDDGDAGPYDHDNCDGTQGLHGNGGNGKCAGCTGKADDKWPGGQNVGDHNNGYECDHNSGIGKGNPAHSRCATIPPPPPPPPPCCVFPPPPPPCVDNPNTPMDECNPPPPPCVDNPNTPMDECNPPPKPPKPPKDEVEGIIIPNVEPPQERQATRGGPSLPVTGATVNHFLWLALLLMGAGSLLLWRIKDRGANA